MNRRQRISEAMNTRHETAEYWQEFNRELVKWSEPDQDLFCEVLQSIHKMEDVTPEKASIMLKIATKNGLTNKYFVVRCLNILSDEQTTTS